MPVVLRGQPVTVASSDDARIERKHRNDAFGQYSGNIRSAAVQPSQSTSKAERASSRRAAGRRLQRRLVRRSFFVLVFSPYPNDVPRPLLERDYRFTLFRRFWGSKAVRRVNAPKLEAVIGQNPRSLAVLLEVIPPSNT